MDVAKCVRNFLKRLEKMEKAGKSEKRVRGKFVRKGIFSGVYEYLVRIGLRKEE